MPSHYAMAMLSAERKMNRRYHRTNFLKKIDSRHVLIVALDNICSYFTNSTVPYRFISIGLSFGISISIHDDSPPVMSFEENFLDAGFAH